MTKKDRRILRRQRRESIRWQFWAYIMDHFPRFYRWANKHLPIDTLPF